MSSVTAQPADMEERKYFGTSKYGWRVVLFSGAGWFFDGCVINVWPLAIQQIPEKVAAAATQTNPSILVRHLLEVGKIYNSYYMVAPVIVDGVANPARLLITQAVQHSLITGLALCHIECPEAI